MAPWKKQMKTVAMRVYWLSFFWPAAPSF